MTATAELNFNFRGITPPKTSKSQLREAEKRPQGHNNNKKKTKEELVELSFGAALSWQRKYVQNVITDLRFF